MTTGQSSRTGQLLPRSDNGRQIIIPFHIALEGILVKFHTNVSKSQANESCSMDWLYSREDTIL